MFLTRTKLNPCRSKTIAAVRSPQVMHAAVLAAMPDQPVQAGESGRVLWRVDSDNPYQPLLYCLSPLRPDMNHVVEQMGWPEADSTQFESKEYRPLLAAIEEGATYTFRLAANPVHAVRGEGRRSKRFGHVTAQQQLEWLLKREAANGFSIPLGSAGQPAVEIRSRERVGFRRGDDRVTLTRVTFEGSLCVTDADLMRRAMTLGIGKAKAYGCGLMTLAP